MVSLILILILTALLLAVHVFVSRLASRGWLPLVFNAWADSVRGDR
jgi:hypothetical protein